MLIYRSRDDDMVFFLQYPRITPPSSFLQIISKLMSEGATLDSQDWEGQTALHWAAREGSVVAVLLLIDGGADTSVKDKQGRRFTSWVRGTEGVGYDTITKYFYHMLCHISMR